MNRKKIGRSAYNEIPSCQSRFFSQSIFFSRTSRAERRARETGSGVENVQQTHPPERKASPQSATTTTTDKNLSMDALSRDTSRKDLVQNPIVKQSQVSPAK